ncbi:MAG: NeuB family protein [Epsilonproteobacteria bacterium]|nr:NeuB family protein [Campylobacterota bacterium]
MKNIDLNNLQQTFIIAEIGSNHNQSLSLAKEMISAAKESGADAVKFQSINIKELYFNPTNDTIKMHKKIDLLENWHYELKEYCDDKDIIFFSAPTYLKAINILENIGVVLHKLASAQVGTFPQLVEKVIKLKKPTLLSTGIVSYEELSKVIKIFFDNKHDNFAILHCNSLYPTPYEKANLNLIQVYKSMFNKTIGYSDHTNGIYASLAAVTLGAKVIEKHFTTDKTLPIPDASISITPKEFKDMVEGIRAIEQALTSQNRVSLESEEKKFKEAILYRLILKRDKKPNENFTEDNFEYKRHPSGIDCRDIDIVVKHMCSKYNLKKGELLTWGMLAGKK